MTEHSHSHSRQGESDTDDRSNAATGKEVC